jgi:hypothetical protein
MTASASAPSTRRTHPIASGLAPGGPSACEVPVVPNNAAAASTAATAARSDSGIAEPYRTPPRTGGGLFKLEIGGAGRGSSRAPAGQRG